jgi:putative peptidoglycan binding protein/transglycosylase-like protein with SLT domain
MSTPVEIAGANGIVIAEIAWEASRSVGVPFWATCAFLVQESAGGQNVFGHDPTIFVGAGEVTEEKYAAYKAERISTGKCQGVGPMQLTFHTFQDEADALGGCYLPEHNVTEGLRILKGFIDAGKSWHQAAAAYNGSETYAVEMDTRFAHWQQLVGTDDDDVSERPRLHTSSPDIGIMQTKLGLAGYYHGGDEANFYGSHTRAAVRKFQEAQGWSGSDADGLLGPVTWERILALPAETP